MSAPKIAVLGAGAWGTALAAAMASDDRAVTLWARDPALADAINRTGRNPHYLSDITLPASLNATADITVAAAAPILLMVTPAQHLGAVLAPLADWTGDLVLCAKGIEAGTGRLMHQVAAETVPHAVVAILSGPTFAHEVAAGLPAAVTLACAGGTAQWQRLAPVLARPALRPYFSDDCVGAELGGAIKNVLAIACGVVAGLGLGENARAALISRGFAELSRFGLALGARPETLGGLSGLGDLVLTCNSTASRNFALGLALGRGEDRAALLAGSNGVTEGVHTAPVLAQLAARHGVAMPLVEATVSLLAGTEPAAAIVARLLARPLRAEAADAVLHDA